MEPTHDRVHALVAGAVELGVDLSEPAAAALLRYLERMLEINETLNLTGVTGLDACVDRHVLDSLAFGLHVANVSEEPRVVIDVGTGAGFPGVPIAVAWPRAEVHLVDATRKKIDAVRTLLEHAPVRNATAHWARAESIRDLPRADAVVARAVGPLAEILSRSAHLVARGGHLVAWKSDDVPEAERRDAIRAAARLGMEAVTDLAYEGFRRLRLVRFRRRKT